MRIEGSALRFEGKINVLQKWKLEALIRRRSMLKNLIKNILLSAKTSFAGTTVVRTDLLIARAQHTKQLPLFPRKLWAPSYASFSPSTMLTSTRLCQKSTPITTTTRMNGGKKNYIYFLLLVPSPLIFKEKSRSALTHQAVASKDSLVI